VSEKKSKGLGDQIANLTKATGIDKLVHAVAKDCGCEERQQKLNNLFPGRHVAMSEEDIPKYEELIPSIDKGRLSRFESRRMYDIYNRTFNANAKPCNCTGQNRRIVSKLKQAYEYRCKI
tara:strand:+ start:315 stop:674 length:360 start_codon:yes stop_codon:yes gene_type:complete